MSYYDGREDGTKFKKIKNVTENDIADLMGDMLSDNEIIKELKSLQTKHKNLIAVLERYAKPYEPGEEYVPTLDEIIAKYR